LEALQSEIDWVNCDPIIISRYANPRVPVTALGQELPRRRQTAVSALPPEATAIVTDGCVRFGPISTFRIAENSRRAAINLLMCEAAVVAF
jgi:hypothetical protein